jgi:hypothetical protein
MVSPMTMNTGVDRVVDLARPAQPDKQVYMGCDGSKNTSYIRNVVLPEVGRRRPRHHASSTSGQQRTTSFLNTHIISSSSYTTTVQMIGRGPQYKVQKSQKRQRVLLIRSGIFILLGLYLFQLNWCISGFEKSIEREVVIYHHKPQLLEMEQGLPSLANVQKSPHPLQEHPRPTVLTSETISETFYLNSSSESLHSLHPSQQHDSNIQHHQEVDPTKLNSILSPLQLASLEHQSTVSSWITTNMARGELILQFKGPGQIRRIITAFIEPPLNDTVPGTGSQGAKENDKDSGIPPDFYIPLPLRTIAPEYLQRLEYPKFQTCRDLPAKLPVDRGFEIDPSTGHPRIRNVGQEPTPDNYPQLEAPYCPVESDPFLPWIHDMFPAVDGSQIEFIAQNKRRCKTGKNFRKDLHRLEPQVALMQSVSVQRIHDEVAQTMAPELWHPKRPQNQHPTTTDKPTMPTPRYRLAPYEEASPDGKFTRFICRFHVTNFEKTPVPEQVMVGETLSTYPFNYDFIAFRKDKSHLLTPKGKDTNLFWTSTLRFACPVPEPWREVIARGLTILSDGTPTFHVTVVPIRTSPRYGLPEMYFTDDMAGPSRTWKRDGLWLHPNQTIGFDAAKRWGNRNVLPLVEASGRWTNLPICQPASIPVPNNDDDDADFLHKRDTLVSSVVTKPNQTNDTIEKHSRKLHLLSACLWAADSFKTRGVNKAEKSVKDTRQRLVEWIEFHLMVGLDHIYVYDNSGAHTNETTLADILSRYPSSKVTRIDWPSLVCNNNIPAHDNTGERSSQYAAENSCRTRAAPFTEWIASFDTDEYLVPMGNYSNLREVVLDAERQGTNILTFLSSRGRLRMDSSR